MLHRLCCPQVPATFWIPGVVATIALVLMNLVPRESLTSEEHVYDDDTLVPPPSLPPQPPPHLIHTPPPFEPAERLGRVILLVASSTLVWRLPSLPLLSLLLLPGSNGLRSKDVTGRKPGGMG